MSGGQMRMGREKAGYTQVQAARQLGVSQPYLSQLEQGVRQTNADLARKSAILYQMPIAFPVDEANLEGTDPQELQFQVATLGYPGFSHVRNTVFRNPVEVVLRATVKSDLDTRLVEALPWVLMTYVDLDWPWLRDRAKLSNVQNRLGYLVHVAKQVAQSNANAGNAVQTLSNWQKDLEYARLAKEGTLCRDSMPERERQWLRANRPEAAVYWNLLTGLTANQLSYA